MKKINLEPLENTVVLVPDAETFDKMMQIYEAAGWTWYSGDKPTQAFPTRSQQDLEREKAKFPYSNLRQHPGLIHGVKTVVYVRDRFSLETTRSLEIDKQIGRRENEISYGDFLKKQRLTEESLKKILG